MKLNTFFLGAAAVCVGIGAAENACAAGADVIYSQINGVTHYVNSPFDGIDAYSLGTVTCNASNDTHLLWASDGTPAVAMNAFRLYQGRLEQIGTGWAKTACCVANSNACGFGCQSGPGGYLRAGCSDTYSAGWNAIQSNLAPRSRINPYTGVFQPIPSGSFTNTTRRLQIPRAEMSPTTYPGALYFVEGIYVCTEEAASTRAHNNASYRRVNVNTTSYEMTFPPGETTATYKPGIEAWRDHGGAGGGPDSSVEIDNVDVPGEGRFVAATKVRPNGDGTWRYEYALYNINSDRAGGSFSVPVPPNAKVTNIGFHGATHHSGEPWDNSPWTSVRSSSGVTWSPPAPSAEGGLEANAIRWGTMYNFWFDSNLPPVPSSPTIGLFKPAIGCQATKATYSAPAPGAACPADIAGNDREVDTADLLALIGVWGPCGCALDCGSDFVPSGGNGQVDVNELLAIIGAWGPCD